MSLSERIEEILDQNLMIGPRVWWQGKRREITAQILTALEEEGYICVGKETVKKIMGEEETDG